METTMCAFWVCHFCPLPLKARGHNIWLSMVPYFRGSVYPWFRSSPSHRHLTVATLCAQLLQFFINFPETSQASSPWSFVVHATSGFCLRTFFQRRKQSEYVPYVLVIFFSAESNLSIYHMCSSFFSAQKAI